MKLRLYKSVFFICSQHKNKKNDIWPNHCRYGVKHYIINQSTKIRKKEINDHLQYSWNKIGSKKNDKVENVLITINDTFVANNLSRSTRVNKVLIDCLFYLFVCYILSKTQMEIKHMHSRDYMKLIFFNFITFLEYACS